MEDKVDIEKRIKILLSQIKNDTEPNKAVSVSIAVLNLANAQNALKFKNVKSR